MGWDSDFLEMLPHTVVVSTRTGHNNYAQPTWSTSGSTYRARIVHKPSFLRGLRGETMEVGAVIWVASTGTISVHDKVTLSDGTSPELAYVERVPDEDGTYFHKLYLKHSQGNVINPLR